MKYKGDAKDTTTKTKSELDLLKKKLIEIEGLIQAKNEKLVNKIQKQKLTLYSIQKLVEASDLQLYQRCQVPLEYMKIIFKLIFKKNRKIIKHFIINYNIQRR